MAWEWSHSPDAYRAAERHVHALSRADLLTILREWAYDDRARAGRLRFRNGRQVVTDARGRTRVRGFRLPAGLRRLSTSDLADLVWTRASEHRTCSNGGWDCYVCPDGCHSVPFSDPTDHDESETE